jgi:hypothetical protein
MKRAALIAVAFAAIAIASFAGGYWYRHTHPTVQAEMEDYSVSNVLDQVGYVHYLNRGDTEGLRNLIDVHLNSHLARVIRYEGAITDDQFLAARTRTLNAVAVLWDERPPFAALSAESRSQPWWPGWEEMTKQNRELVKSAREKCAAEPSLKCRARTENR